MENLTHIKSFTAEFTNNDNLDVPLSNCSETNALMNEDDKSLALLWIKMHLLKLRRFN